MQIAICDDDSSELARLSSFLDTYRQDRCAPVTYKTFLSPLELLSTTKSGDYALYLLDVMMPGLNGMETAQEIRSFDTETKIVFLTSSPEFAVESYAVKAHDYILKPARAERLFPILDALLTEQQRPYEGLTVKTQSGITRILFSNLAYVEVMNKRVYFYLVDGSVREATAPLAEFESALLSRPEFVRVHRSYIVNLWQVSELNANGLITHAGKNIPVSRLLYGKVRDAYIEQLFGEKGVAY